MMGWVCFQIREGACGELHLSASATVECETIYAYSYYSHHEGSMIKVSTHYHSTVHYLLFW